jgi:hypothetical protein
MGAEPQDSILRAMKRGVRASLALIGLLIALAGGSVLFASRAPNPRTTLTSPVDPSTLRAR